jgi:diguanylate cyclase (GGDEF)-like protein
MKEKQGCYISRAILEAWTGLRKEQGILVNNKRTITLAAIVILTTAVFTGLLFREYRNLTSYMGYIAENGKSALFHEEYINQRIAYNISTALSSPVVPVPGENDPTTVCQHMERINGIYGLNLVSHTLPALTGTLQTRSRECHSWAADVPALAGLLNYRVSPLPRYSFSNYTGYTFDNMRYYINLNKHYIYINRLIDSSKYVFQNWLMSDGENISIDTDAISLDIGKKALADLQLGNNIVSHIYKDSITGKNIISTLNPVFVSGKVEGVLVTDFTISDLATSFYTPERPVLWSFLTIYVADNRSGKIIQFHQPSWTSFTMINFEAPITRYYTLHICLDFQFFILNQLWMIVMYILTTLLLCQSARYHLDRNASLARDNVTDPLTGLFNRKIINAQLDEKIQSLLSRQIAVTIIAIDCDGLKRINDTLGHHTGDEAIKLLGSAITTSLRKSDYGIRPGGDEFNIILLDAGLDKAREVIQRITDKLLQTDERRLVAFSWGSYQMQKQDTLETAFIKADKLLYEHKERKYAPRNRKVH